MHGGNKSGRGHKGERQRGNRPRLGFEGGQTPFYLIIPKYGYNVNHRYYGSYRSRYTVTYTSFTFMAHKDATVCVRVCVLFIQSPAAVSPLSLRRLQYLIDLGRVDPMQPIDLTQLVNCRGVAIQPLKRDYGIQLIDEVCIKWHECFVVIVVEVCHICSGGVHSFF